MKQTHCYKGSVSEDGTLIKVWQLTEADLLSRVLESVSLVLNIKTAKSFVARRLFERAVQAKFRNIRDYYFYIAEKQKQIRCK